MKAHHSASSPSQGDFSSGSKVLHYIDKDNAHKFKYFQSGMWIPGMIKVSGEKVELSYEPSLHTKLVRFVSLSSPPVPGWPLMLNESC